MEAVHQYSEDLQLAVVHHVVAVLDAAEVLGEMAVHQSFEDHRVVETVLRLVLSQLLVAVLVLVVVFVQGRHHVV